MTYDVLLISLVFVTLVLVVLGFRLAFCLGAAAVLYLVVNGFPLIQAVTRLTFSVQSFTMLAIPLFMLAGKIMNEAGVTDRIFSFAQKLVGRIPGGLGHVNVIVSLIFAGMSGSVLADVGGVGSMELKAMKDHGYDDDFSIGITLASSIIGPVFPPSVPMVLFGIVAEISITALFLGGLLPGIVIALFLMIYVFVVGYRKGYVSETRYGFGELVVAFGKAFPALLTPVIIVGGMTLGIFSPTEAATVTVLYAVLLGRIYGSLSLSKLGMVLNEVVISASKLLFVIAASLLFGWTLTVGGLTGQVAFALSNAVQSPWAFLLLINVSLLVLGSIIQNAILLMILGPMLVPIAVELYGIDPVHFGVIVVLNIMIGQYTPPMAMSIYLMRDLTGLSVIRITKAVFPFLVPLVVALLVVTYVPDVVLFLPRALGIR
jgi:tripartite ATP-independent transporter DctM subunit